MMGATSHTVVHRGQLAEGPLHLPLTAVHPHKHPEIEVHTDGQEGLDVARIPVGVSLHTPQNNPKTHLMTVLRS